MPVLIVDDDPVNLKLLSYLLRGLDAAPPQEFADPLAALDWCAAQRPALAIVDRLMPGLNGLEFVERLRRLPQGGAIPVLMISADVDDAVRREGDRLGVAGYLRKPVSKAELLEKAAALMPREGA